MTGKLIFDDKLFWCNEVFAIQCLIFSICSPFRTCEHINIQTYRHLDIYDGGKQPITGEPGPGTGCDGHAVSVRFICWGLQGFNWFDCLAPPFLCAGHAQNRRMIKGTGRGSKMEDTGSMGNLEQV